MTPLEETFLWTAADSARPKGVFFSRTTSVSSFTSSTSPRKKPNVNQNVIWILLHPLDLISRDTGKNVHSKYHTTEYKSQWYIHPSFSPFFTIFHHVSPWLSQKMLCFFVFSRCFGKITRALCSGPPGVRRWRGRWGSRTSAPPAARRRPRTAARARCGRPPRRGNPGLAPGWGWDIMGNKWWSDRPEASYEYLNLGTYLIDV